jgi:hypothetical protein
MVIVVKLRGPPASKANADGNGMEDDVEGPILK